MADVELSEIILTEAARCARGRLDSEASARLIRVLNGPGSRNHVYQCCLDLAQDPGRRQRIMMLLRHYVLSFPPSLSCLRAIEAFCHLHSTADVSQELLKLTETLLREAPMEGLAGQLVRTSKYGYASEFALQQDLVTTGGHGHGSSGYVPIPVVPEQRLAHIAVRKNESQKCYAEVPYRRVWCPPYMAQFPLLCLESTVQRQLNCLSAFSPNYKTNRSVVQATLFFIKQMCDGYVAKLPLPEPSLHFRGVTICYLPMLLDMMESDYLCVRNHVYDFIWNLGVHLQLVDPAGVYPGCTEAVEQELVWLLLSITERQAVLKVGDETTWTAAAKCILAVVPPCYQHLVDCVVLSQILQLPGLGAVYPEAFSMLAMAFARGLLSNKDVDVPPAENLLIDEVQFAKLGSGALSLVLNIYRHCTTPGARKALFQLLLACAARRQRMQSGRVGARVSPQLLSPEARAGAFRDLVSVDFFWNLEPLLHHMSEVVQRELPRRIADGLAKADFDGTTKSWTVVVPLVDHVLGILADDAELPGYMQARFKTVEELRRKDEAGFVAALQQLLQEVADTVPALLEGHAEGGDCAVMIAAWRLAFVSLRWSARYLPEDKHRAATERLTRNLVLYTDERGRSRNRARYGHLCTYLLSSLAVLCRTSTRRDLVTFRLVLEIVLFDRDDALELRTAMVLASHLLECFCEPAMEGRYRLHTARDMSDVAMLVLRDKALRLPSATARLVTPRVLWGLYRSLAQSQEAAVCRVRHAIVLMLAHQATERGMVEVRAWKTLLADAYPPVALLAAEKILYLARGEERPTQTGTANDTGAESTRDVYHEATRILEKGFAGKRGKPPVSFGLLHEETFRDGERGDRHSTKAFREMALS